jgi:hypothetical protein
MEKIDLLRASVRLGENAKAAFGTKWDRPPLSDAECDTILAERALRDEDDEDCG